VYGPASFSLSKLKKITALDRKGIPIQRGDMAKFLDQTHQRDDRRTIGDRKASPLGASFLQISQSFFNCLDFRFQIRQICFQFCDLLGLGLVSALKVRLVTAAALVISFCVMVHTRSIAIAFIFTHIEFSFLKMTAASRSNPSPAWQVNYPSQPQLEQSHPVGGCKTGSAILFNCAARLIRSSNAGSISL
jgi:hypothetical protein